MYFPGSASVARRHPELGPALERVDHQLASIRSTSPLRVDDFVARLGLDWNRTDSLFRLLADAGVLRTDAMLACAECETLHSCSSVEQLDRDEEVAECSYCGTVIPPDAPRLTIYRLSRISPSTPPNAGGGDSRSPTPDELLFRRNGDYWEIAYANQSVLLKDMVGLFYLSRLLMEQGRDVLAVELLAARGNIQVEALAGSSGEILDSQAIGQYRDRYYELTEALEEARADHDLSRLSRLESEWRQLAQAITEGVGLGGRVRRKSDVERVRKSVSNAITKAVRKIHEVHPALGRHLDLTVTCGKRLRYAPETPINWTLL